MFRSLLAASIVAAAAFGAAGAHAQDDAGIAVSARGVDFSNPADVHRLYGHIRSAAERACDDESTNDMFIAARTKACEDTAINQAVTDFNRPELTQLAQRHGYNDNQMAMRDRRDEDRRGTR
jgi:UrcA family protein